MTGKQCCICGRNWGTKLEFGLYRFPMNKELSDEWAKNIGKKVIIEMSVSERNFQANVCWRHFEPKMFVHIVGGRLKKYAVPTLLYKPGPASQNQLGGWLMDAQWTEILLTSGANLFVVSRLWRYLDHVQTDENQNFFPR
jgi:hypothetical protein